MPIKKLPKDVASKIAAGEVVERPMSVIKELIENAIDAEATEITISVEEGGRRLIEVVDNGIGIGKEEVGLSVERYATSKISAAEDLDHIRTLGFRGEALASISSVSRFSIESKRDNAATGYQLVIEGGQIKATGEIGMPTGTRVTVRDLFFNVPARLKFLKTVQTEKRQINHLISRYALFYDAVRYSLYHDGKRMFSTSGNRDRIEVLSQIYDLDTAKKLLPVDYTDPYITIRGFTSPYNLTRASRSEMFFFVNGRLISDSAIASAINRGYHGLIMVGRYPISILFLELEPSELDVNVHPTKTEIRLKDNSRVFTAVQRIIRKTIAAYSPVPVIPPSAWSSVEIVSREHGPIEPGSLFDDKYITVDTGDTHADTEQAQGEESNILPLLRVIGQLGQTYVAAEGPDGLYLIDQHAAHERVLFEKLMHDVSPENTQLLLEPSIVNLGDLHVDDIQDKTELARSMGFKIEDFGPQSIKLTGVPQALSEYDPHTVFMDLLAQEESEGSNILEQEQTGSVIRRICKRISVKGGQRLSREEQEKLVRDLEDCTNPRTCPHGRPTIIHISVDALARRFGRTGSI